MKILSLFFILLLSTSFTYNNGQCDIRHLQQKAQLALNDFTFIKQFPVEIGDSKAVEISYVFSSNAEYRVAIADNGTKGHRLIVKLFDRNKKLISSNIVAGTRELGSSIDFNCPATGVYFIEASFEKHSDGCGLVVLGFKKSSSSALSPAIQ